jgi:phospholipid/cholesterol/gamma-HCH transport system substrate-binding protein
VRRLWINAAAFLALFALLGVWAVRNVLHLDMVERPHRITAEFATSPGLRSGFEVTYFGVHAGSLGRVAITGDHVTVTLKIDRDLELPAKLDAAVRRKSAVGEPYVDLTPSAGVDRGGPRLRPGAVIPVSRTTTPLSYADVFTSVDDLVTAIPTGDLHQFLHSLAAGFEGRGGDLRAAIVGADKLTSDLVDNLPLLDQLAGDLTTLTHTITEHRDAIGSSWDSLAALSQTLSEHRADLAHLLDTAPRLTDQVDHLLTVSGPDIGCIVDSAASIWSSLDDPVKIGQFEQLLTLAGPAADIVHQIAYQGPDGLYLNGVLTFDVGIKPVRYYDPPLTLPPTPALRSCTAPRANGAGGPTIGASGGNAAASTPTSAVAAPPRTVPPSTVPASSHQPFGGKLHLLPWLLVAGALVAAAIIVRRRRMTDDQPQPEETTSA